MNASNTEKLVKKCFCQACNCDPRSSSCITKTCQITNWKSVARSARRFVRLEQAEEREKLAVRIERNDAKLRAKPVKLPPHFGEIKINGKWTKF
jgi:ribosomal protein S2